MPAVVGEGPARIQFYRLLDIAAGIAAAQPEQTSHAAVRCKNRGPGASRDYARLPRPRWLLDLPVRSREDHIGRRHPAKARVPRDRIPGHMPEHDPVPTSEPTGRNRPLPDDVFLVTGRPDDEHAAAVTWMRRHADELDLAPAQMADPRQIDHAQRSVRELARRSGRYWPPGRS